MNGLSPHGGRPMMRLGHYDPDATRPALGKLFTAIARYQAVTERAPTVCHTSPHDAADLAFEAAAGATLHVTVHAHATIAYGLFYVGEEEGGKETATAGG